jgi:hypothetical protein
LENFEKEDEKIRLIGKLISGLKDELRLQGHPSLSAEQLSHLLEHGQCFGDYPPKRKVPSWSTREMFGDRSQEAT